ncbi:MAG: hypothetical protein ACOZNI_18720 [Myxococcota bacterium]
MVQRFGSAMNLNLHSHVVAADGVFLRDERGCRYSRGARAATGTTCTRGSR